MELRDCAPATVAVHAGERRPERPFTPTVSPIYASNTFVAPDPEEMDAILGGSLEGYTYTRHHNPTVAAFEEAVALLEGAEAARAYASGMAALAAALLGAGVAPGDRVLLSRDLYGATVSLVRDVFGRFGVEAVTADLTDPSAYEPLLERHRPRAVVAETLSNPLLRVVDVGALASAAHAHGAQLIVDNTFTTPLLCRPLELGADLVVHSATKYLGGHGDATGGVVVGPRERIRDLYARQKLLGDNLGPFEAWLLHRGLKTLPLRFQRQSASAWRLAQELRDSGRFRRVVHPLLPDHPDAERVRRLYPGRLPGAVVSVDLGCDREGVFRFLRALRLVVPATTVGDVYTLCLYPWIASHRSLPPEEREAMGVTEGLVRFAVGLEEPGDLLADILQAAEQI